MSKIKAFVYPASLLLLIAAAVFFSYSFACSEQKPAAQMPAAGQQIIALEIPGEVEFAGEKISLTRYDQRERFDRELTSFTYSHSSTLLGIKRANRYFPIIEPILKRNGVPTDFKYLALIESNFNLRAISPAKASGFWQFMPETAKQYGLEVNGEVDERYHIEKATEAACRYLKKSYAQFGDWLLVAASYNAGVGRIASETAKQQVDSAGDLWLNDETSRYIFRLLAIKTFLQEPQRYGYSIRREQFYPHVRTTEVTVNGAVASWADFAKQHSIPYVLFKEHNVWIRSASLTNKNGKTYRVQLPKTEDLEFDVKKVELYQANWAVD